MDINEFSPKSGRIIKEDNTIINMADLSTDMKDIAEATIGIYSKAITGTAEVVAPAGYYFFCIVPSSTMVVAAQDNVASAINADLTAIASHPASTPIYASLTSITPGSGDGIGYMMKE
jgi:hypothetical protein